MALTQIVARTTISTRVGPVVKRWPAGAEVIRFVLDDALFTQSARRVNIVMQCSWNNKATWPFQDLTSWQGGIKAKDGSSPSVTLGPFQRTVDGQVVTVNPTHVRFYAEPAAGSANVTVGLLAEVSDDD
jgi:hypothetical protein